MVVALLKCSEGGHKYGTDLHKYGTYLGFLHWIQVGPVFVLVNTAVDLCAWLPAAKYEII